jgi:hypothetical protein
MSKRKMYHNTLRRSANASQIINLIYFEKYSNFLTKYSTVNQKILHFPSQKINNNNNNNNNLFEKSILLIILAFPKII